MASDNSMQLSNEEDVQTKLKSILKSLSCNTIDDIDFEALRSKRRLEIINLLHQFNDIKDATQALLGALANHENITLRELYKDYDLPLND